MSASDVGCAVIVRCWIQDFRGTRTRRNRLVLLRIKYRMSILGIDGKVAKVVERVRQHDATQTPL